MASPTLEQIKARQREIGITYTERFMQDILADAALHAPIEEGTLRGSTGQDTDDTIPGEVTITGFFSVVYAGVQEYYTDWNHPKGGEAHYLQNAYNRRINDYPAGLAKALELSVRT